MDTTFDISLLIGADFYWQIVGDKIIRGDGPTAVSSRIGYFLSGPLHVESSYPPSNVMEVIATHVSETTDLTRFWDIESMGVSKGDCEDTDASSYLQQYQKSCISFSDGNYTAKLPWKQNHQPLPSNYNITKKRTECAIKRLSQKPQMLMKYNDIIQEQENRGFIERVDESSRAKRVHYIPHHGVEKNSTTTPIRIVYDCSCRQSERSPSLNDCLESTPPELNDLTTLLLRFRLGRYAVSTDIEKAFLHVGLHEDDRAVTRFLWLSDPTDPKSQLVTYRFRVVLFGATCSPFILNATLLKHMTLNASNPAANIITRDLYVDNVISSFQQEQDLLTYFRYARALMSEAGFNLRSWTSNSSKLCEYAVAEKVLDKDKVVKVLGMLWDPDNDEMSFVQRTIVNSERTTKRFILKQTSKLYDPLGLLSPVTVRAKLLVQDLWKKKFDWDTPLPVDIINTWTDLSIDLNSVIQTKFQRPYFPTTENTANSADFNLHVFVDASARAYGAVAYLTSGHTSTIVFAKNRVAPVKEITLPRLELMAALIGARVTHHVSNAFTCKKITSLSDSQNVLSWLKSTNTLKRFMLNRVEEIKKLTPDIEWRYCPTDQNPADLQTRGLTAIQLQSSTLWKNGPTWLIHNNKWPTLEQTRAITFTTLTEQNSEEEIVSDKRGNSGLRQILELNRYSSFHKLLRVTAYVIRFTKNCRVTYNYRQICPLSTEELRLAEGKLIETCQQQYFPDVIQDLKSQKKRSPIIRQLRLYLDKDGCIRCGGRIHNAQLPETTRFPFLMSPKSHVTRLIIEDAHYNQLHAGVAHTVTHLRQKYWIPSIRQHVKSVLRRCVICRKVTGRPYTAPDPPPLPVSRVIVEPPFLRNRC
ncbi:uncharacterized protein LOC132743696 [Ruditapes philippinarum]|uniref:uncharacterized protein LOC132743696 n=1 Tax=Ruditapes philippinarum TaxID=129788 RepID=UPI00295BBFCB|nr:uncharacterized protein LOC132743696 [Ruditapes philippinarum]